MWFNNKWIIYLICFLSGLVSVFGYAPFNFVLAIIISLVIFIYLINQEQCIFNKKQTFLLGFIYGLGFFGGQLYWIFYSLYVVIDAGVIVSALGFFILIAFLSLYIGLVALCYKKLKTKYEVINLILFLPSIWVLVEWLRGWLFTGFPWGDISYTLSNAEVVRGVFPVLGSYGVSYLFISVLSCVYILLDVFIKKMRDVNISRNKLRLPLLYLMLSFLVCSILQDRVYTVQYGQSISVALVQGNIAQSAKWNSDKFLTVYEGLIAKAKADVVIIPETAISTFAEYLPKGYLDNLVNLAKNNNAQLVIGIPKIIDKHNNYVNSAILLTSPNKPYYAKNHLVPFGEYIPFRNIFSSVYNAISLPMVGFSAGTKNQEPLVIANQKFAFNICYENGFNSELIKATKNATIMANLSDMVWYGKTIAQDEHLQISQVRALENQRYFVQDTNTGLTAVINPRGEIQSRLRSFEYGILVDRVYGMVGSTPFENLGNYPIIIWCFILLLLSLWFKMKTMCLKRKIP